MGKYSNKEISENGQKFVIQDLEKKGYEILDKHKIIRIGYDFAAVRESYNTYEVKSTGNAKHIPKLVGSEVNSNYDLIADYLIIVYVKEIDFKIIEKSKIIYKIIPKKDILKSEMTTQIHFTSKFQKQLWDNTKFEIFGNIENEKKDDGNEIE